MSERERTIDDCKTQRERVAFIVEDYAQLYRQDKTDCRNLDVALDAIEQEFQYEYVGGTFNFSAALALLKRGDKVRRSGWNGKGMWLIMADAGSWATKNRKESHGNYSVFEIQGNLLPHIVMKTVQNEFVPWLASQTDLLADDWQMVKEG